MRYVYVWRGLIVCFFEYRRNGGPHSDGPGRCVWTCCVAATKPATYSSVAGLYTFQQLHCKGHHMDSPSRAKSSRKITDESTKFSSWDPYRGPVATSDVLPEHLRAASDDASFRGFYWYERETYPVLTSFLEQPSTINHMKVIPRRNLEKKATDIFGTTGTVGRRVLLPGECKPEVYVISTGAFPCFTAEAKTMPKVALTELLTYGAHAIIHSYFPNQPGTTVTLYNTPPVCYGLLVLGSVGYIVLMEMVGRIFATLYSHPFLLGSPEHKEIVTTLFKSASAAEVETVTFESMDGFRDCETVGDKVIWTESAVDGKFIKVIHYDLDGGDTIFPKLVRTYEKYTSSKVWERCDALKEAQLRFSEWAMVVLMPFQTGASSPTEKLNSTQLGEIVEALVVLFLAGMRYVDLKLENILIDDEGHAILIDYDDIEILAPNAGPVTAQDAFNALMETDGFETRLRNVGLGTEAFKAAIQKVRGGGGSGGGAGGDVLSWRAQVFETTVDA